MSTQPCIISHLTMNYYQADVQVKPFSYIRNHLQHSDWLTQLNFLIGQCVLAILDFFNSGNNIIPIFPCPDIPGLFNSRNHNKVNDIEFLKGIDIDTAGIFCSICNTINCLCKGNRVFKWRYTCCNSFIPPSPLKAIGKSILDIFIINNNPV